MTSPNVFKRLAEKTLAWPSANTTGVVPLFLPSDRNRAYTGFKPPGKLPVQFESTPERGQGEPTGKIPDVVQRLTSAMSGKPRL